MIAANTAAVAIHVCQKRFSLIVVALSNEVESVEVDIMTVAKRDFD